MANYRENQFELFGFDFLIDEDFRTWLIEVKYPFYMMLIFLVQYKSVFRNSK